MSKSIQRNQSRGGRSGLLQRSVHPDCRGKLAYRGALAYTNQGTWDGPAPAPYYLIVAKILTNQDGCESSRPADTLECRA